MPDQKPHPKAPLDGPYTRHCQVGIGVSVVTVLLLLPLKLLGVLNLPGHVELTLFITPTGLVLLFAGLMLVDVNLNRRQDFIMATYHGRRSYTQTR
ncbi:MAG: hypothetical protein AAF213_10865, partial [Pseudomonadota bacterium]